MEDYEDEPDLNEQIFHNNVREQIVSIYNFRIFGSRILLRQKASKVTPRT